MLENVYGPFLLPLHADLVQVVHDVSMSTHQVGPFFVALCLSAAAAWPWLLEKRLPATLLLGFTVLIIWVVTICEHACARCKFISAGFPILDMIDGNHTWLPSIIWVYTEVTIVLSFLVSVSFPSEMHACLLL